MIRKAFVLRLKPGGLPEYKRRHDEVWPELVQEIDRSGIARITIFAAGEQLFLYSEIEDADAWDRLWDSEIHRTWARQNEPLMEVRPDGIVAATDAVEVFHLQTDEASRG